MNSRIRPGLPHPFSARQHKLNEEYENLPFYTLLEECTRQLCEHIATILRPPYPPRYPCLSQALPRPR